MGDKIVKARTKHQEMWFRLWYQFLRVDSELNRVDKQIWTKEYLDIHLPVWRDKVAKEGGLGDGEELELMVASFLLQRFLLDRTLVGEGVDDIIIVERGMWEVIA